MFIWKIQVWKKYGFWFSAKFISHKNGSKCLIFVLKIFTQGRPTGRPTESNPLSGCSRSTERSTGQRVLLSVSRAGRPGGRPLDANGQKSTVGWSTVRSTGRPFLAVLAANGYIFLGAINTPLVASFL